MAGQTDAALNQADAALAQPDASAPVPDASVPNQPPVVTADNAATDEDTPIVIDVLANDLDKDPSTLTVTSVDTAGTVGAVTLEADNTITYDPRGVFDGYREGDTGTDTFQYTIADSDGASHTGAVTVMITGVNDLPGAQAVSVTTQQLAIDIPLAGGDVDGGTLTFAIDSAPSQGTLGAIVVIDGHNATVTYTPAGGAIGSDSFTYTVSDGLVTSTPATVDISITGTTVTLTAVHTFDTDSGELDGVVHPAWTGTELNVGAVDIPVGAALFVTGSQAFVMNSDADISVAGLIDVSGEDGGTGAVGCNNTAGGAGGNGGPGGFSGGAGGGLAPGSGLEDGLPGAGPGAGGNGATNGSSNGSAGGGGAGHNDNGTSGQANLSAVPTGGASGPLYASLPPLLGGSGGGGGTVEKDSTGGTLTSGDDDAGGGGGGGGAARLVAAGILNIDGLIDASGGEGGVADCAGGDGGGGSGGALVLLAPGLPTVTGVLDVTGGGSGTNGGLGADGRVVVAVLP